MNINNAGAILNWKGFEVTIHQPLEHDVKILKRDFRIKGGEFTNEELAQYEAEYNAAVATMPQKAECIKLLDESEIHVSNDPPYPEDVPAWIIARVQWRAVLKSDKLEEIQEKPF